MEFSVFEQIENYILQHMQNNKLTRPHLNGHFKIDLYLYKMAKKQKNLILVQI